MARSLYTTLEGPKGKAEVYQATDETGPGSEEYVVVFNGREQRFGAEGEAMVVAMDLVGTPDPSLAH